MECRKILFTRHCLQRMFQRRLLPREIEWVVRYGKIVGRRVRTGEEPSVLIDGQPAGRKLRVAVRKDRATGDCHVITAYDPDAMR